ncbi:MAG: hypothetical protein UV80_C0001G0055 [Candidatus Peregrinibacteria bacterium GW2011_GWF2_43_17]|nr:MAG: hypothetical protein UV80_C0001G0055 [Candidatus Peregrinibacteria bacterium GW2011_GWF2_43_17]
MKKTNLKAGFTLIEMIVSICIFTIFISMLAGTYLYIARAQRETAEARKVYSGLRDVVEEISEEVKLSGIYYDCYSGVLVGVNECSTYFDLARGSVATSLALMDDENLKIFVLEDGKVGVKEYEYSDGLWVPKTSSYLSGEDFNVDSFYFGIFPAEDPSDNYEDLSVQYQPHVTLYVSVSSEGGTELDLQTSISVRKYE